MAEPGKIELAQQEMGKQPEPGYGSANQDYGVQSGLGDVARGAGSAIGGIAQAGKGLAQAGWGAAHAAKDFIQGAYRRAKPVAQRAWNWAKEAVPRHLGTARDWAFKQLGGTVGNTTVGSNELKSIEDKQPERLESPAAATNTTNPRGEAMERGPISYRNGPSKQRRMPPPAITRGGGSGTKDDPFVMGETPPEEKENMRPLRQERPNYTGTRYTIQKPGGGTYTWKGSRGSSRHDIAKREQFVQRMRELSSRETPPTQAEYDEVRNMRNAYRGG